MAVSTITTDYADAHDIKVHVAVFDGPDLPSSQPGVEIFNGALRLSRGVLAVEVTSETNLGDAGRGWHLKLGDAG